MAAHVIRKKKREETQMKNFSVTRLFDNLLDAVQSMLMSYLTKLGPFFVALMPAMFTASAVYFTSKSGAGPQMALFYAVVVGMAFETIGIVSVHTAVALYNAMEKEIIKPVKFRLMAGLVPIYVIGVAAVVFLSEDAFTPLVRWLGIASPFLTSIVYVAVALARDIKRIETKQSKVEDRQAEIEADERVQQAEIEAEGRAWKREQERLVSEMKHKERLAKIEAKTVQLDAQNVQPAVQATVQLDGQIAQKGPNNAKMAIPNAARFQTKQAGLDGVLEFLSHNPRASYAAIGRHIGRSKSTGENYVNELKRVGRLGNNGDGWDVIE